MTIILIGILVIAVAVILSLLNMLGMVGEVVTKGLASSTGNTVKKGFKNQVQAMILCIVGLTILACGIVLAIF